MLEHTNRKTSGKKNPQDIQGWGWNPDRSSSVSLYGHLHPDRYPKEELSRLLIPETRQPHNHGEAFLL